MFTMLIFSDSQHALDILERLQERMYAEDGKTPPVDVSNLIYLLDSPLFTKIASLQDSMVQLKQVSMRKVVYWGWRLLLGGGRGGLVRCRMFLVW